ncbi:Carboxypeptidase T, partial [Durusdinium trenchii]
MAGLPCLPKKLPQPLRSIQVGEIVELCLKFDVTKLTPPAFARIVEVYAIAKAKHLVQEIWEAKHLPKGARSMEKLTTLPEVEDKLPYMCASCFTSWILPAAKKCLHCGSMEGKVPTALPSASVTVDGVTWTMTFDADKQLCWQSDAPDLGDTQKSLCSVEVSSLGQKPPMVGATPSEVTFSELVSDSSRMTLRQEVLKRGTMRSSTRRSPRSPRVMDHDPGQETVTFHPTNVKAMRLVSELGQAERREKKEAHGAAVLRRLDVEKFRSFLKRKWQDEKGQPQDALLASQTTLERKQKRKLELLLPTYDTISVWPEKAYLRTRELIKQGTSPYQPRLLEEIVDCPLNMQFMEYQDETPTGASGLDMGGSAASGSKLAMIHAMLGYHKGEVRAYGGQWTTAPGPMVVPEWASKKVDAEAVWALERRTHPYNLNVRWGDLVVYTS